jgi:hypothetical protein
MEYYKNLDLKDIVYFCDYDLIWKTEQWKDIIGYEGIYKASCIGRIKSLDRIIINSKKIKHFKKGNVLKQTQSTNKYLFVGLHKKGKHKNFRVHQLVAMAFLNHKPNGYLKVVDHIDNDIFNNNYHNLQLISNRENSSKDKKGYSSKYSGVSWQCNKWIARIRINGKKVHLGYFLKEHDAYSAVQSKLKEIGEI